MYMLIQDGAIRLTDSLFTGRKNTEQGTILKVIILQGSRSRNNIRPLLPCTTYDVGN